MKKGILLSLLGLATGVLCLFELNRRANSGNNRELNAQRRVQRDALRILEHTRIKAFDGSEEKLALALGRPLNEIQEWASGAQTMDADARMKVHSLAMLRGVN